MNQSPIPKNQTELIELWNQLSPTRKLGLGVLVVVALAGLIFFVTWAQTPDYTAAFTDLNADDGAAIVEYLTENDIPYQITNNGQTIRVPSDQVHEVRLALAGQGLPSEGTIGFELFDSTNLSMTDFIQQVNYQRALEGELARTIGSLTTVRSARVHVVIPQPTLFSEDEEPATASIVVDLEANQQLTQQQVRAIGHLVSSAVEGLSPENLTIVDMEGNILADGSGSDSSFSIALSANQIEAQHAFEQNLERRIETMLQNVLGPDKAVVRVNAEMNWDQVETESETFSPGQDGGVLRSSHLVTETYIGDVATAGGVPGVDANIPDAAATYQTGISGTNGSSYQRSDATTNYEVSRSVSRIISASGQVERLSVSVLVNNITDTVTINAIEQATIAAAGIDTTRGDVLTVNNITFDRSFQAEQEATLELTQQREFYLQLAQWGAVAIALIALLFILRSMIRSVHSPPPNIVIEDPADPRTALLEQVSLAANDPGQHGDSGALDLNAIGPPTFNSSQQAAAGHMQMLRQLQLMAKSRPETLAQIIQFWLAEEGGGNE